MKSAMLSLWAWVLAHPEAVSGAVITVLSVIAASIANARAKGAPVTGFEKFVDRLAIRTRANASNAGWSIPGLGKSIFEAAMDVSAPEPSETQAPPPPLHIIDLGKLSPAVSDESIYVYRDNTAGCWVATPREGPATRPSARGATPEEAKTKLREMIAARAEELRQHPERAYEHERASAGFAELGVVGGIVSALGLALFLGLSASMLSGCPRLPAAEGCASGAVRCSERGVPQTCDSQGRWTPMDDQCSAHEAQCCVTNAYSARVIAVCLPMSEVCHAAQ